MIFIIFMYLFLMAAVVIRAALDFGIICGLIFLLAYITILLIIIL